VSLAEPISIPAAPSAVASIVQHCVAASFVKRLARAGQARAPPQWPE
jgi:hypothetical protein